MGVLVIKEKDKRCPKKGIVEVHTEFLEGKLYFRFVKDCDLRLSGRNITWIGEHDDDIAEDSTVFKYLDFT